MDVGHACVRVCPEDKPEVLFSKRLDPCRARVISVPLPESDRRYGDILLHDGEPRGRRQFGRGQLTVFDELQVLERSRYGTWRVKVECRDEQERDALVGLFDDVDGAVEDWTDSVVMLCAQCSLGEPHDHHEEEQTAWRSDRELGLALKDERDLRRLRQLGMWWRRGIRDVARVL
jgi:hypothetical protein